jgi:hypothetical protein
LAITISKIVNEHEIRKYKEENAKLNTDKNELINKLDETNKKLDNVIKMNEEILELNKKMNMKLEKIDDNFEKHKSSIYNINNLPKEERQGNYIMKMHLDETECSRTITAQNYQTVKNWYKKIILEGKYKISNEIIFVESIGNIKHQQELNDELKECKIGRSKIYKINCKEIERMLCDKVEKEKKQTKKEMLN